MQMWRTDHGRESQTFGVSGAKRSESRVRFGVEFDGKPDGDIQLTAYAFDGRGTFLGAAPVRQGVAELGLRGEAAASARIFFGPQLRDQEAKPTIEAMERIAAYEPAWRYDPGLDIQKLLPIPSDVYQFWPICRCRVRGQVVRPVKIGSVTVKYPVQNARVHICEVDKIHWWIERLPEYDLFRLRDELLEKLRERIPFPFPIPLPDPPPYEVFLKTPIDVGGPSPLDLVGLNPQPLPPREFDQVMLNPRPGDAQPAATTAAPDDVTHGSGGAESPAAAAQGNDSVRLAAWRGPDCLTGRVGRVNPPDSDRSCHPLLAVVVSLSLAAYLADL